MPVPQAPSTPGRRAVDVHHVQLPAGTQHPPDLPQRP
jgi:hypothetical protein